MGRVVRRHGWRQPATDDRHPQTILAVGLAAAARSPSAGRIRDARDGSRSSSAAIFTRSRRSESFERPASICGTTPSLQCCPGPWAPGGPGWPSLVRGLRGLPPAGLDVEEGLPALEENGFSIFDFTPERVTMRYFRWKLGQPEAALDTLEPFRVTQLAVPGR